MSVINGVKVKRNKLQFSRLTNLDGQYVREKIKSFLQEDGSEDDITTNYSVGTSMKIKAAVLPVPVCARPVTS